MSSRQDNDTFRREGARRSLRSLRCQSVVITEKERSLLIKQSDKKSPAEQQDAGRVGSKGFVRSMCKFYSDIIGGAEKRRSVLDRSASFTGVKDGVSLESVVTSDQCLSSPVSSRSGSFRLNRSRSWRGSRLETYHETHDTPKRNSPTGQSVRSQDSGFSDSGENMHPDIDGSYESQSSSRTVSSSDEQEASSSYVTKINIETVNTRDNHQDHFRYRQSGTTPVARQKVTGALDNIASLQEGFKIKLESEPRSLQYNNQGYDSNVEHFPSSSAINNSTGNGLLLRTKVSGDQETVMSPSNASCPRFSTPVRSSFRRRTMINMEDPSTVTPVTVVKRESRTRLKEIKSRRRWSTNIDQDHSKLSPLSVNTSLNSRNSSSQLSRNSLKADSCCHELRNQDSRNVSALSLISPVQERSKTMMVDTTATRLMMESFITQSPASRSINTILPQESVLDCLHHDTIMEHESSPPVLHCNKSQDQAPLTLTNTSLTSNR